LESNLLNREKYLTELAYSPINHKEQLKNLFTSDQTEDILRDLEVYNGVTQYILILQESKLFSPQKYFLLNF
jgi:hypothetical protein